MNQIEILHFNPSRYILQSSLKHFLPIKRPLNNFGDLLGPKVVEYVLNKNGLSIYSEAKGKKRLLTIGSILHLAKTGDVIWGSGKNGKVSDEEHKFDELDIRAVRGPLTREFLIDKGFYVPENYGDPALLLPKIQPYLNDLAKIPIYDVTYIPNYNDYRLVKRSNMLFNPRLPLVKVLERIAQSKLVIGSSLHAIIIAESLGIPARAIISSSETEFKYADYYLGTGRNKFEIARTTKEAIEWGGEKSSCFSTDKIMRSFPLDLWG